MGSPLKVDGSTPPLARSDSLTSDAASSSSVAPTEPRVASHDTLFPPQYGRPARPSSPDVFNALFNPVLRSLSRPASPARRTSTDPSSSFASNAQAGGHDDEVSLQGQEQQRANSSLPSHFPPRNPTDPSPTVESQGFVLYISSALLFVVYLAWSFLPDHALDAIGIEWYPSREWALLIPSWITVTVLYVYVGYLLLNMSNTISPQEYYDSIDDPKAFIPPPLAPPSLVSRLDLPFPQEAARISRLYLDSTLSDAEAIPPLYDLPLDLVDRVLYG
ncbi:hypothetical protein JCM3766R1_001221 [Sporobolomyces carnicolor]